MSEFTAGVLYPSDAITRLQPIVEDDDDYIKDEGRLNDRWRYLLLNDPFFESATSVTFLKALSKEAPLLYFFNAEDHGWGYRVFVGGDEVSRAEVSYEWDTPDDAVIGRALQSANPSAFNAFGLTEINVKGLTELLDPSAIEQAALSDSLYECVEQFKHLVDIEEMEWML